jgi:hypothetical protein
MSTPKRNYKIPVQFRRLERQQDDFLDDLRSELPGLVTGAINAAFARMSETAQDPAQMLDAARALIIGLKHRCEVAEDANRNLRRAAEVKRK